jgi:hypothetical protein
MYSPTLGRFMQTDPIGYGDGINWYDYVDGDPVNRSDPSGLMVVGNTCSRTGGRGCAGQYQGDGGLGDLCASTATNASQNNTNRRRSAAASNKNEKVDTSDRTTQLATGLREVREKIRQCGGSAASAQCKPLWDEHQRILNSPEMRLQREMNQSEFKKWVVPVFENGIRLLSIPVIGVGGALVSLATDVKNSVKDSLIDSAMNSDK